jgi:hypothetical protein
MDKAKQGAVEIIREKREGGKRENKKENGGVIWTFHPLIHISQSGIRSTSTATAGAATATTGALPNAPLKNWIYTGGGRVVASTLAA